MRGVQWCLLPTCIPLKIIISFYLNNIIITLNCVWPQHHSIVVASKRPNCNRYSLFHGRVINVHFMKKGCIEMTTVDDIIIMTNLPKKCDEKLDFLLHFFFRPFRFRNGTIYGLVCKAALKWASKRNPIKCLTKIVRQWEISVKIIRNRHPSQKRMALMFNSWQQVFLDFIGFFLLPDQRTVNWTHSQNIENITLSCAHNAVHEFKTKTKSISSYFNNK